MNKTVVLDVCKHEESEFQTFVIRQGDRNSLTLNFVITEDGEPFDVTEYEARFMAALIDSDRVIIAPCEKTGANTLSYTLPGIMGRTAGTINLAYIAFYKDEEWVASTSCMVFDVQKGVDITPDDELSWLPEFEQLKAKLDLIVLECKQMQMDIATQMETQQEAWEKQMVDQQAAFEAAEEERNRAEALRQAAEVERNETMEKALDDLKALSTISNEEIDVMWSA